jgi:paraquat-inducible protein A
MTNAALPVKFGDAADNKLEMTQGFNPAAQDRASTLTGATRVRNRLRRAPIVACPTCDLLQYEIRVPEGRSACCHRCGTALYRQTPGSIDRTLALSIAALVLLAIANSLPIASIEIRGITIQTTLYGAIEALWTEHERGAVAGLVFVTTIAAPVIQLGTMLYMLLPLRLGYFPQHLALAFRIAPVAREWGLIDVFMLGVVVSLIKLGNLADVVLGPALWSFAALIVLLTFIGVSFNAREMWMEGDQYRERRQARVRQRSALPKAVS